MLRYLLRQWRIESFCMSFKKTVIEKLTAMMR